MPKAAAPASAVTMADLVDGEATASVGVVAADSGAPLSGNNIRVYRSFEKRGAKRGHERRLKQETPSTHRRERRSFKRERATPREVVRIARFAFRLLRA